MRLVNENAKMNTDFHYAYELMDILRTSAIEPSYSMVKGAVSHLAGGLVPPLGLRSPDGQNLFPSGTACRQQANAQRQHN